jgi:hypothetical protein
VRRGDKTSEAPDTPNEAYDAAAAGFSDQLGVPPAQRNMFLMTDDPDVSLPTRAAAAVANPVAAPSVSASSVLACQRRHTALQAHSMMQRSCILACRCFSTFPITQVGRCTLLNAI